MSLTSTITILLLLSAPFILASTYHWQYQIYVSSSIGVNSSCCGAQGTPCATLGLALQVLQCNSTAIYLSPGVYTLDSTSIGLEQQQRLNDLAIIGDPNEPDKVSIICELGDSFFHYWLRNIFLQCVTVRQSCGIESTNVSCITDCHSDLYVQTEKQAIEVSTSLLYSNVSLNATVVDCYGRQYAWKNDLQACTLSVPDSVRICSYTYYEYYEYCSNCAMVYVTDAVFTIPICYSSDDVAGVLELSVATLGPVYASTNVSVQLVMNALQIDSCDVQGYIYDICLCGSSYLLSPGYCASFSNGVYQKGYCPWQYNLIFTNSTVSDFNISEVSFCPEGRTDRLCGSCSPGYGVPINILNKCVQCDEHYPLSFFVFVLIELLPITVMVLLIIVFNIQLTNGSINGLVFYCQVMTTVYPGLIPSLIWWSVSFPLCNNYDRMYANNDYDQYHYNYWLLFLTPANIFNLDFTPFIGNYPLCITPHMSPLEAIFFWYVIPLYPLLLLLLFYVWILLYDKSFKCVVLITRPFHRCLARFWRMTNIEPSLTHSTASIYLLCFTQLAATSFKLLQFTKWSNIAVSGTGYAFFYDGSLDYFHELHGFVGFVAILVLLFLVFLPLLYIQLYPFKLFHKLLDCLHLRKQILISLGDVFTGPYKNGSDNTFDYRFFSGFYFLLRIFILCSYFIPLPQRFITITSFLQSSAFIVFGGMIMILRPFSRNIHNLSEFFLVFTLASLSGATAMLSTIFTITSSGEDFLGIGLATGITASVINGLMFGIILPVYVIIKIVKACQHYHREASRYTAISNIARTDEQQELETEFERVIDDWLPDRMENPGNYNERHVQVTDDDLKDTAATT